VQDIRSAMKEFYRVLRPNGRLIILEFSEPQQPLVRFLNRIYSYHLMPITASLIARDRSGAYQYLPRSIETFISRQQMTRLMAETGFVSVEQHPMTFGVCVCYRGIKPMDSSQQHIV
jgi:demethylmenaquinone methyltransferase/2-methoxy-6-polyprenyl-1,4-benzoquinol methylase